MAIDVRVVQEWGISEWVSLGGVIVTLLLAAAAFITVRTNFILHRKDRQRRVLEKLYEWLIELHTASLDIDMPSITTVEALEATKLGTTLTHARLYSQVGYIKAITLNTFRKELYDDLRSLCDDIPRFIRKIDEFEI